jgi:uncharacterized repeat protein (TIGR03803 family)
MKKLPLRIAIPLLVAISFTLAANAATYKETTLYSFKGQKDANGPLAPLVADAGGNLYGIASEGGGGCTGKGCGAVFELSPSSTGYTETIIYAFKNVPDGEYPETLLMDSNGNLFGSTFFGGSEGGGIIFELSPSGSTWTETILYNFTGFSDGGAPVALVFDGQGGLYGAANQGGATNEGAIFHVSPSSGGGWTESVIYSFTGTDGAEPNSLIMDAAGNLIGTNAIGGDTTSSNCEGGCGTVFILAPSAGTWTPGLLYTFHYKGGATPGGRIAMDSAGNLYGGTRYGGLKYGVAYKLAPTPVGEWKETILHDFTDGADGDWPIGGMVIAPNGAIYGASSGAITNNEFNIFRFTQSPSGGWIFAIVYTYNAASNGANAPSYFDAAGNLYGTAQGGTQGIVYELTP